MENKSRLSQHEQFLKAISDTESTRRKGITKGPVTEDSEFFTRALSDNLAEIQKAAAEQDFKKARTLFAAYIRDFLDRDRFFTIPYETPENIFKLPGESDSDACRRIEDYKVVSVGVLGDFSRERRIGWFSNPTYNGYREWTWQLSRHNEIKMMAHEYNLTGDEKIASAAADIMKSWLIMARRCHLPCSRHERICNRMLENDRMRYKDGCQLALHPLQFHKKSVFHR